MVYSQSIKNDKKSLEIHFGEQLLYGKLEDQ